MFDDGAHNDGVADDGLYAATLAPQANGTIMEFYVQAMDPAGLTRTWPAPAWETNNTFAQLANALYQVDDESSATNMPFLRLIMTGTERAVFPPIDSSSDAEMNATFISLDGDGTKVRYNAGVRIRGAGSRGGDPEELTALTSRTTTAGTDRSADEPQQPVRPRPTGGQRPGPAGRPAVAPMRAWSRSGSTARTWRQRHQLRLLRAGRADRTATGRPTTSRSTRDGNVYRGSKYPWNANLDYQGTNAATYQGQTGAGLLQDLEPRRERLDRPVPADLRALPEHRPTPTTWRRSGPTSTSRSGCSISWSATSSITRKRRCATAWATTTPCIAAWWTRASAWSAHDFDTILGQGDTGREHHPLDLDHGRHAAIDRHDAAGQLPEPLHAASGVCARSTSGSGSSIWTPPSAPSRSTRCWTRCWAAGCTGNAIPAMKTFAADRRAYVLSQIPTNLTVDHARWARRTATSTPPAPTSRSTARPTSSTPAACWSTAPRPPGPPGRAAGPTPSRSSPGINRVLVQSLDSNNVEFARATLDIWYDDSSVQTVSGRDRRPTRSGAAAGGPYQVTANLTVNAGATLTIQPGTTVYLGSGVNLTVANGGTLLAEGHGHGADPVHAGAGHRGQLGRHHHQRRGRLARDAHRLCALRVQRRHRHPLRPAARCSWTTSPSATTAAQYLSLDSSSFVVQDCVFPATTAAFEPVHGTGGIKSGRARASSCATSSGRSPATTTSIDFTGGQPARADRAVHQQRLHGQRRRPPGPGQHRRLGRGQHLPARAQERLAGHLQRDQRRAATRRHLARSRSSATSSTTATMRRMAKQGNFFTLLNNTIVRQTHAGGPDTDGGGGLPGGRRHGRGGGDVSGGEHHLRRREAGAQP